MIDMFSVSGGLYFPVTTRFYGHQDKGISPNGAQDQLSFDTAYHLFDKPQKFQSIEIIYPVKITANKDILFVVCGAYYENTSLGDKPIEYNKIQLLPANKTLVFEGVKKGFRTIFFAVESSEVTKKLIGKTRLSQVEAFIDSNYRNNFIRVTKGPEFDIFEDDSFFERVWSISANSSQMGLLLDGDALNFRKIEMISQPVSDGVIQLSPKGPIVLMRHRQTVGGYPRIVTIIAADINKISQFAPQTKVRFKLISFEESLEINENYRNLFL